MRPSFCPLTGALALTGSGAGTPWDKARFGLPTETLIRSGARQPLQRPPSQGPEATLHEPGSTAVVKSGKRSTSHGWDRSPAPGSHPQSTDPRGALQDKFLVV